MILPNTDILYTDISGAYLEETAFPLLLAGLTDGTGGHGVFCRTLSVCLSLCAELSVKKRQH